MQSNPMLDYFHKEEESFKKLILDTAIANFKDSDLKSKEKAVQEAKENIEKNFELFKADIAQGIKLFDEKTKGQKENRRLINLFTKIEYLVNRVSQKQSIANETDPKHEEEFFKDLEFLESIAKKEVINGNYKDASCMYRFIVQLSPVYSPATVGLAVCEEAMGNIEVTSTIYDFALSINPSDDFLNIFAAEFFASHFQKNKAVLILLNAKKRLEEEGKNSTHTYQEINTLLSQYKEKH